MMRTPIARRTARFALAAVLGLTLLTGCGDNTDCSLDACTVTFDRGVDAGVSVLGIEAKLISADSDTATVEIAGEQITLTVGETATEVAGFQVSLASVTADNVAVKIAR